MSKALRAAADLHGLLPRLAACGPAGARVAEGLRDYLATAHLGVTVDQALGLAPIPGEAPWWTVGVGRPARQALLEQLAALYDPALSVRRRSDLICRDATRWAAASWPLCRFRAPPGDARGALLFALHSCGAPWPLKSRQINALLVQSRGLSAARGLRNPDPAKAAAPVGAR